MKKSFFLVSFLALGILSASDVDSLLHAKEWREKQLFLAKENARKAQQFEYNLYHPSPERKVVFDLFTLEGDKTRKLALRFSRNKMTLGTDRAVSVMEKMRFKNAFEKGEWRDIADLAQRQICHALEDLKHLHVSTFQKLGEALHQSIKESENI